MLSEVKWYAMGPCNVRSCTVKLSSRHDGGTWVVTRRFACDVSESLTLFT